MEILLDLYRRMRVTTRRTLRIEPAINVELDIVTEFHGNKYCGWCIPSGLLNARSVVVDAGLGEDISFSQSLISRFNCIVHGFDPTPRSISYIRALDPPNFVLHECGVSAETGPAEFYLPNNESHVSGSLQKTSHVGAKSIPVHLVSIPDLLGTVGANNISLLKLDIEGAEYGLIGSQSFRDCADRIDSICIEFHHRWPEFGPNSTMHAVAALRAMGFSCAWRSKTTNEEFLFVRSSLLSAL